MSSQEIKKTPQGKPWKKEQVFENHSEAKQKMDLILSNSEVLEEVKKMQAKIHRSGEGLFILKTRINPLFEEMVEKNTPKKKKGKKSGKNSRRNREN